MPHQVFSKGFRFKYEQTTANSNSSRGQAKVKRICATFSSMAFFLRYSLLALLKLFQWAPLLATLNPFSSVRSIDGDSTVLERHSSPWPNPPANYLPAGFTSSNRSSCVSAHNCHSPPSSSTFAYAHLVSQHKHYLSNFVDSLGQGLLQTVIIITDIDVSFVVL